MSTFLQSRFAAIIIVSVMAAASSLYASFDCQTLQDEDVTFFKTMIASHEEKGDSAFFQNVMHEPLSLTQHFRYHVYERMKKPINPQEGSFQAISDDIEKGQRALGVYINFPDGSVTENQRLSNLAECAFLAGSIYALAAKISLNENYQSFAAYSDDQMRALARLVSSQFYSLFSHQQCLRALTLSDQESYDTITSVDPTGHVYNVTKAIALSNFLRNDLMYILPCLRNQIDHSNAFGDIKPFPDPQADAATSQQQEPQPRTATDFTTPQSSHRSDVDEEYEDEDECDNF